MTLLSNRIRADDVVSKNTMDNGNPERADKSAVIGINLRTVEL